MKNNEPVDVLNSMTEPLGKGESPFALMSPTPSPSPRALPYTIALVAAALLWNSLGTVFFWNANDFEFLLCVALGAMLAQPCLLAVWIALGNQKVVLRIPLVAGILPALVMGYLQTLNLLDPGNLPLDATVFFASIALAIFVVVQMPFWIFRLASQQVIAQIERSDGAVASQFSIRQLMITMTIAAVVVLLIKNVLPSGTWEGGAPWKQMIRFVTPYIVGICVLALLCTALVFSQGNRRLLALFIAGVVTTGAASLYYMPSNGPLGMTGVSVWRFMRNAALFFVGFCTTMVGVLSLYYRIGFRLRKN